MESNKLYFIKDEYFSKFNISTYSTNKVEDERCMIICHKNHTEGLTPKLVLMSHVHVVAEKNSKNAVVEVTTDILKLYCNFKQLQIYEKSIEIS
jgi:hypothetical protein